MTIIFILKTVFAALIISLFSYLSGKYPAASGFFIALPLTSLLVLAFSYQEHQDPEAIITFAKSILLGIPFSLLFFLPFILHEKLKMGFWAYYISGLALLTLGFFGHKILMKKFL